VPAELPDDPPVAPFVDELPVEPLVPPPVPLDGFCGMPLPVPSGMTVISIGFSGFVPLVPADPDVLPVPVELPFPPPLPVVVPPPFVPLGVLPEPVLPSPASGLLPVPGAPVEVESSGFLAPFVVPEPAVPVSGFTADEPEVLPDAVPGFVLPVLLGGLVELVPVPVVLLPPEAPVFVPPDVAPELEPDLSLPPAVTLLLLDEDPLLAGVPPPFVLEAESDPFRSGSVPSVSVSSEEEVRSSWFLTN
jgi:hypothetical protein